MPTQRKSFIIHKDSLSVLDELSNEQAGLLFKAMKAYQNDEEIELDSLTKIVFSPFKAQFDRDNEKYQKIVNRNKNNGLKGGRPKAEANPENPSKPIGLNDNPENPSKADSVSNSKNNSKSVSGSKKEVTTMSAKANEPYEIFTYWKDIMSKGGTSKFTAKRMKNVKARLKDDYTVDEIKAAIFGCSITPHNNGTDPRGNGQRYDDLELICRTGENIERFIGNAQKSAPQKYSTVTKRNIDNIKDVELF